MHRRCFRSGLHDVCVLVARTRYVVDRCREVAGHGGAQGAARRECRRTVAAQRDEPRVRTRFDGVRPDRPRRHGLRRLHRRRPGQVARFFARDGRPHAIRPIAGARVDAGGARAELRSDRSPSLMVCNRGRWLSVAASRRRDHEQSRAAPHFARPYRHRRDARGGWPHHSGSGHRLRGVACRNGHLRRGDLRLQSPDVSSRPFSTPSATARSRRARPSS